MLLRPVLTVASQPFSPCRRTRQSCRGGWHGAGPPRCRSETAHAQEARGSRHPPLPTARMAPRRQRGPTRSPGLLRGLFPAPPRPCRAQRGARGGIEQGTGSLSGIPAGPSPVSLPRAACGWSPVSSFPRMPHVHPPPPSAKKAAVRCGGGATAREAAPLPALRSPHPCCGAAQSLPLPPRRRRLLLQCMPVAQGTAWPARSRHSPTAGNPGLAGSVRAESQSS